MTVRNHSLALDVSLECVEKLAVMQEELDPWIEQQGGRSEWTRAADVRLTLVNFDDHDDVLLMGIGEAVAKVTSNLVPFKISVQGLRCLPEDRPRVVVADVHHGKELVDGLRKVICVHLEKLGIAQDDRVYRPAVSLGRIASAGSPASLNSDLGEHEFGDSYVRSVLLLRHELLPRGASTTVIRRFPLGSGKS